MRGAPLELPSIAYTSLQHGSHIIFVMYLYFELAEPFPLFGARRVSEQRGNRLATPQCSTLTSNLGGVYFATLVPDLWGIPRVPWNPLQSAVE